MVQGCTKDSDSGSTQALCRLCYDLIATGDMLKYYANYTGKNWMSDTVMKIVHLQQDKRDLQVVLLFQHQQFCFYTWFYLID
jgi:hypothetical protein